jgi:dipeptidase E
VRYNQGMKLLLTSAGITNEKIAKAFFNLVDKEPGNVKVGFVPTAANAEKGNKVDWFFRQYEDLRRIGIRWIDVIDFSAADVEWRQRLDECDVIYLTGGNTFYLLDQMRRTGFNDYLLQVLDTKVYVGGSASAIALTPSIAIAALPPGDPNLPGLKDLTGLGLVDFEIRPHCTKESFTGVEAYAKHCLNPVYALDDQSAIRISNGEVGVISQGEWRYFDAR